MGELWQAQDESAGIGFAADPSSGELSSLRLRRDGGWIDILYKAGSRPGWRGGAPWLFPAVGRSFADGRLGAWLHGGRARAMPIHGFLMSLPWEAADAGKFASSPRTRELYPFDFAARARYAIEDGALLATLEIVADRGNPEPMPFSVGNHLSLRLPLGGSGAPLDCRVRAPAREIRELSEQSLLDGRSRPAGLERGVALREDAGLGDRVLGGFAEGGCWLELREPSGFGVRVSQRELSAPRRTEPESFHFVLYSDLESFFCPEPWYGGPNSLNEGRGLVLLEPGARFSWQWELRALG